MFSSLPNYYVPEDGTLAIYKAYVKDLPHAETPEAFGQHVTAEISSALVVADDMLGTLLSIQGSGGDAGGSAGQTPDQIVTAAIENLQPIIPEDLDQQDIEERNANDSSPLKVCLLQEIERYNTLLVRARQSLHALSRGIQGFVVISEEQELVYKALFDGKPPQAWMFCYPSLRPLSSWMPDLLTRIDQLNQWGMYGAPKVFWLGGFTFPTSFLTALLQASARRNQVSVDTLSFDFLVQGFDENQVQAAPKEGAMMKNMILEGGRWDQNIGGLAEPEPMCLYAPMPILHFKPIGKKKGTTEGFYSCPLYLYPVRTGSRERPSFMAWVDLKAGAKDGPFWTKRGTAMLLATG